MNRGPDRTRLAVALLLLALGLVLLTPAIIFLPIALLQHHYTIGFDPATLRLAELITGAGLVLLVLGSLTLRSSLARRRPVPPSDA